MKNKNTFICGNCEEEFEFVRPDGEAENEALELFGVDQTKNPEFYDIVCDDCFNKIMGNFN